jgi:acetolactate synthase-1/2/3 large subunit
MQELAAAAMLDVPVCTVVLNNSGWISIKGGQQTFFGRTAATDFQRPDGSLYSPDFEGIGRAFGVHAEHVTDAGAVCASVRRALESGGPSLVAIDVARELDVAGPDKTGWWDVPVPEYHPEQRREQLAGRAEEQHQ